MHQENCQLKSTLDYSTDRIVFVGCNLRFLHPLRLLESAILIFVLIKFFVSEYDSFRFSLSFSASFWLVFVEPGAAPPVQAKVIGRKLLYSTSRILCCYFSVLTLS